MERKQEQRSSTQPHLRRMAVPVSLSPTSHVTSLVLNQSPSPSHPNPGNRSWLSSGPRWHQGVSSAVQDDAIWFRWGASVISAMGEAQRTLELRVVVNYVMIYSLDSLSCLSLSHSTDFN